MKPVEPRSNQCQNPEEVTKLTGETLMCDEGIGTKNHAIG
jgi:hypothetical protein